MKMLQEVGEIRMCLGVIKELDLDIERQHPLKSNTDNKENRADRNRATSHPQKAMEEVLPDEKKKCSPPFKNRQGKHNNDTSTTKTIIAEAVVGTVKWFNGYIHCKDIREGIFVHQTAIIRIKPYKMKQSVRKGETIELNVIVGEKEREPANVTGPDEEPVQGSPYAANRRRFCSHWVPRKAQLHSVINS